MRSWRNLGVVETIYEEEYEHSCSSSASSSPSPSSPPATLQSRVQAWSVAKGCETDVLIRVDGTSFHLHKDPLTSRSTYLKRQLTDLSDLTISPPLNITAQTFSLVADLCYGAHLVITPFNVAALRIAAELLQMTDANGAGNGEDLKHITEAYFSRVIAVNQDYASIVFRSCLNLLPEAETTAFMVSRCIEALNLTQEEGYGIVNLCEDVIELRAEDFKIVAESIHLRFACHDVVYEIIDLYLKEHNGKITEEQKTQLCSFIDCNKLSAQLLLQAVQNPRMPLRFIIRAMLAEQLNTHRSIFSATTHHHHSLTQHHHHPSDPIITLGTILQRDAALREAAQLKAAMNATSLRIQNLENELSGMKKILDETEKEKHELIDMNNRRLLHEQEKERNDLINGVKKLLHQTEIERGELNNMNRLLCEPEKGRSVLHSGRSVSFHYGKENKIERDERGSISSLNVRFPGREERPVLGSSSPKGSSCNDGKKKNKNLGQRLISGLKSAFRVSKPSSNKEISSRDMDANKARYGNEDHEHEHDHEGFMVIKEDLPFHLRNIALG